MKIKHWKNIHRWIAMAILLPLVITSLTGILLILRSKFEWIQPNVESYSMPSKWVTIENIYSRLNSDNKNHVKNWKDIKSIIIKPSKGTILVRNSSDEQIQLSAHNGEVLSVHPRRTSFLIRLHEGSYWGTYTRDILFTFEAFGLFFLLISGIILIINYYKR